MKMAEEDEVDILGDCSLDNFLSKSETLFDATTSSELLKCDDSILISQNSDFLKCDYTIHPQWLLDKPSTNPACWYSSSSSELSSDVTSQSDIPQISFENSITDESGWTEKEKNLLNRGIEIFGKSNVRLSQFIGSKTPAEVKYYLKNFFTEVKPNEDVIFNNYVQETVVIPTDGESATNREILDDAEIPASIEEVIAAVSTAKPTIAVNNKSKSRLSNLKINYNDIPSGHSLLKKNFFEHYLQKTSSNALKQRNKLTNKKSNVKHKNVKVKFQAKTSLAKDKKEINVNQKIKRKHHKVETNSNIDLKTSEIEIVTGQGLSVPVYNGEEVIKIKKGSESDVEVDIIDTDDEIQQNRNDTIVKETNKAEGKRINEIDINMDNGKYTKDTECGVSAVEPRKTPDLTELCEDDVNFLKSMEFPQKEYVIDMEKISDLEKFIHYEFFEGRATKTPMRYLKIRNHILNAWNNIKPAYVTKTSIRQGLKQCGDVNCIGRIHQFLEQIGAINFKCPQTSYVRPLYELVLTSNNVVKDKSKENEFSFVPFKFDMYYRSRNKKKYIHDGEGGYTLQHDESGNIINTTVINEDPVIKKTYTKKPIIRLIYCRSFNNERAQQYQVKISLMAILLMDLHAHTSLSEVMGLVGGHWNDQTKILSITRYEPCKNIASSSTHCDMCPVTQAKAADTLHGENLDILGWFHSHPTFAPEPSQQDIETQLSVQQWVGDGKPCIGVILSPFSSHGALIASPYRCMVVEKKDNFEDQFVPYKLKVEVILSNLSIDELMIQAKKILSSRNDGLNSRVDFKQAYFQDTSMNYVEKFISSVKMHLAKCSDLSKMTCDAIIHGFENICNVQ